MAKNKKDTEEFQKIVLEEVKKRKKITFAEFMSWALFHPRYGYYTAGPLRTGRQGDFFTNVQVGDLFAKLLAESFFEMWNDLGCERFSLVELGGSDGVLAERLLRIFQEKKKDRFLTYYLIETSPYAREQAERRLSRFSKVKIIDNIKNFEHIPGVEGCVFSNEFFDALPFHRVQQRADQLQELYVTYENGNLSEKTGTLSDPALFESLKEEHVSLEDNQKAEVCLVFKEVVSEIDRILARGFVLSIDYGKSALDLYRPDREEGTLQVYEKHRLVSTPFENIGNRDLTAYVDFTRLARLGEQGALKPLIFNSQGTYFLNSSQKILKEVLEKEVRERNNRSMAAQVQQLVHPQTFGGQFSVLVQGKNVGDASLSGGSTNRIHRLKL